jgi:flavin-binding protein dodecin
MGDHTYRVIEVVGSSSESVDAAIRNALDRVTATTRNVDWFEVTEIRGHVAEQKLGHIQVGLKVGFRIEDE